MSSQQKIETELRRLQDENARLRQENVSLRNRLNSADPKQNRQLGNGQQSLSVTHRSKTEDKVRIFRSLFRGRDDLYAIRWENRQGKAGYAPACGNEWHKDLCGKPKVK